MNAISSISAVAAVAALLLAGCRREDAAAPSGETRTLGIRFTTEQPLSDDGEAVGPVLALRFEEGTLREVLAGTLTAETGLHLFPLTRAAGELRFVANGADFAASGLPEPGAPLGELLDRVLPLDGMTSGGLLLTGLLPLDGRPLRRRWRCGAASRGSISGRPTGACGSMPP